MKASGVFLVFPIDITLCVVNAQPVRAAENSWTTKASMPTARTGVGVAVVNGKIYAIGGYSGGYLNINEMYDPVTDTWASKSPMPTPRAYFAVASYQNKICVIAGSTGFGASTLANEVYDPATDTWETKAPLPSQTVREDLSANVVNGKIYVISGAGTNIPFGMPNSNENNVYDPATDTWTTKAPIPTAVQSYASAVVGNKIYIIGGRDLFSSPSTFNLTQIYDTVTDTWSYGSPMPTRAHWCLGGATTGLLAPKRIYVLGGYNSSGLAPWLSLTQVYDPETNAWTTGAPAPSSFARGGVAVVNDIVYAIGGNVNLQYTPIGYMPPPDTTPPTIFIVSPENKTYTVNNVSLTFTVSEQTSWIGYSLDGQANVTINGNTTLFGLSAGSHSLIVCANDTAGNTGTFETIYFTIEIPLPDVAFPPDPMGIPLAIAVIAAGVVAFLIYFRKIRKTHGKTEKTMPEAET